MDRNLESTHYVIVLNPTSGRGAGGNGRAKLEGLLRHNVASLPAPSAVTWEIIETQAPGDGTRLAAKAAAADAQVVVAAGGDGTLGDVVNGIVGSGVRLGLIPLGTGNDFARNLGLNNNLEKAVHTLFYGACRPIDLGCANGRWFINVAGCGFDAIVAERVNHGFRFLHGTNAFVAAVLQSLWTLRASTIRLTLDGEARELRGLLCAIANAPMYGGGMRVAPEARIDDGWLDICIIAEAGRWEFIRAFPRVFAGTHVGHPKVTMLRARSIAIESEPPMRLLVDGEVIGSTPATFSITPAAINLFVPR